MFGRCIFAVGSFADQSMSTSMDRYTPRHKVTIDLIAGQSYGCLSSLVHLKASYN